MIFRVGDYLKSNNPKHRQSIVKVIDVIITVDGSVNLQVYCTDDIHRKKGMIPASASYLIHAPLTDFEKELWNLE